MAREGACRHVAFEVTGAVYQDVIDAYRPSSRPRGRRS